MRSDFSLIKNVPHTTQQRYYNEAARQEFGSVRSLIFFSSDRGMVRTSRRVLIFLQKLKMFHTQPSSDILTRSNAMKDPPKRFDMFSP